MCGLVLILSYNTTNINRKLKDFAAFSEISDGAKKCMKDWLWLQIQQNLQNAENYIAKLQPEASRSFTTDKHFYSWI